jgi:hypothetical protein
MPRYLVCAAFPDPIAHIEVVDSVSIVPGTVGGARPRPALTRGVVSAPIRVARRLGRRLR